MEMTCGVIHETPVGPLSLFFSSQGLMRIRFGHLVDHDSTSTFFEKVSEELNAYFSGELKSFSVRIDVHGTAFQRRIWKLLESIPYSETRSYGQIAHLLGDVRLARSVGRANSSNPIPIIIPCHRVVGANGQLTGYSGGIHRKDVLLRLEALHTRPDLFRD